MAGPAAAADAKASAPVKVAAAVALATRPEEAVEVPGLAEPHAAPATGETAGPLPDVGDGQAAEALVPPAVLAPEPAAQAAEALAPLVVPVEPGAEASSPEAVAPPPEAAPTAFSEEWRAQTRLRWATLTADLHVLRKDILPQEVVEPLDVEAAPAPALAPLDPPCLEVEELLAPLRARLRRGAAEKLAMYDIGAIFPRPEDGRHECRDGYELHLLGEALKELRRAITKHYNHGCLGHVWRIVGGSSKEGIIVRLKREIGSPKEEERLSTGALVEQMDLAEERLQYRLLEGTGPKTGWISTRLKVKGSEKDLAVRVELGEDMPGRAAALARVAVLGLMASHIGSELRAGRLRRVLEAVRGQVLRPGGTDFVFALSWSAATPALEERVRRIVDDVLGAKAEGQPVMLAVHQGGRCSQFQHLRHALEAGEARVRELWEADPGAGAEPARGSVWVVFGDDDDIWHSRRVSEYVRAIQTHPLVDGVGTFATTTRVNCSPGVRARDETLPVTEEEVEVFLKSRRGVRMDSEEACQSWRGQLRARGLSEAGALRVPEELCLEYFDFCPRLRLVREFFTSTSPELLSHRYCDLRFNEFLCSYPRKGKEMGLEVAFFEPSCWMLFYATPIPDTAAWQRGVEGPPGELQGATAPAAIDVNNGHMSSTVVIEPAEEELARRVWDDFRYYEAAITTARLARYWAAFRNALEVYLVRKVGGKVDQRIFDAYVYLAVSGSFFKFTEVVCRLSQAKAEAAFRMMYYIGQGFAKEVATSLRVSVLWHKPNIFLQPEGLHYEYEVQTHTWPNWMPPYTNGAPQYAPPHASGGPWKYSAPNAAKLGYYPHPFHGGPKKSLPPWKKDAYGGHPHGVQQVPYGQKAPPFLGGGKPGPPKAPHGLATPQLWPRTGL